MSEVIRIFLADDHILLRDALAKMINDFSGYRVIATAGNGLETLEKINSGNLPDILILDLNMPEMDGFDTAKVLYQEFPNIKVLCLTMYDSEVALIRLLHVGVKGFMKKDVHPNQLLAALKAISEEGYYYEHSTTGKLANLFLRKSDGNNNISKGMLTDLEIKFLRQICTDLTYKEIAHELKMTPRTIDNYRDHLFDKLGVHSRVGLAIYALKNGIITF